MYVAITRAKERLWLSHSASRFLHGKRSQNVPSRYLKELGYIKTREKPNFYDDYDTYSSYNSGYSSYNNYTNDADYNYNKNSSSNNTYSNYSSLSQSGNKSQLGGGIIGMLGGSFGIKDTTFTGANVRKGQSGKTYEKGQKVRHAKFGDGIVINFNEKTKVVTVAFTIGVKTLASDIAKLDNIE